MIIQWNIVNLTGQELDVDRTEIRQKIRKLEKLLSHFPEDAVHLQIIVHARPSDRQYQVHLNLRIPSDVLQAAVESRSLLGAIAEGEKTLARRLKRLKARDTKAFAWRHHRARMRPERAAAFNETPLPDHEGPQSYADVVIEVLKKDYGRLLGFVTRQLEEYVLAGWIPEGAIEPDEIVGLVAEEVLSNPDSRPKSGDCRAWCSSVAFRQTRKAVRRYAEEKQIAVPIDLDASPDVFADGEDDLDLLRHAPGTDGPIAADTIADPRTVPPDEEVDRHDMLAALRAMARRWPKIDREVFHLHFLEGMSVEDLAHTFGCERAAVEAIVARLQARLQALLSEMTDLQDGAKPSSAQSRSYAKHLSSVARG